jgi:hypothetical protein
LLSLTSYAQESSIKARTGLGPFCDSCEWRGSDPSTGLLVQLIRRQAVCCEITTWQAVRDWDCYMLVPFMVMEDCL